MMSGVFMVLPAVLLGCCNAFSYDVSNNKLHLWDANLRIHSLEPSRRQHFRIPSLDSVSSSALKASTEKTSIFSENYWKSRDIPNKLTLSRIFAIPLFVLTFLLRKRATTLLIFVYTCLTDFLDGYLARRWKLTSPFGAFLDPVADKLMVASAMILLTSLYPTLYFVVPVALILCREIAVSALREWMAERGERNVVKVGVLGKIKTTLQMLAMVLLLVVFPDRSADIDLCVIFGWPKPIVFMTGLTILYLSAGATVLSGYQYFQAALPLLTKDKQLAANQDSK